VNFREKLFQAASKPRNWFIFFALFATGISVQSLLLGLKDIGGVIHTHYNNYVIFKYSFWHLLDGKDLYQLYPSDHYDLYKYSPSFALLFGLFAGLPDWIGLALWNTVNATCLVLGIYMLKGMSTEKQALALGICAIELFTSLHNAQANGLMAGLMILGLAMLQREQIALATLLVSLTFFIKLFGIVAFSLFLFFPHKGKMLVWTIFWFAVLSFLPLLVVNWNQFVMLHKSWFALLTADHGRSYGFSVMGWLYYWFGLDANKFVVLLLGILSFVALLFRFHCYRNSEFRLKMLALVLLWVILFNHMTESPTIIIGMAGAAIWFNSGRITKTNVALILFACVFTSLSSTDLFPAYIRKEIIYPYVVKIFPLITIWMKLMFDLWKIEPKAEEA
jgi:hypothetical protein